MALSPAPPVAPSSVMITMRNRNNNGGVGVGGNAARLRPRRWTMRTLPVELLPVELLPVELLLVELLMSRRSVQSSRMRRSRMSCSRTSRSRTKQKCVFVPSLPLKNVPINLACWVLKLAASARKSRRLLNDGPRQCGAECGGAGGVVVAGRCCCR